MNEKLKQLKVMVIRSPKDIDGMEKMPKKHNDNFHKLSVKIANKLGNAMAFYIAVLVIFAWAVTGPIFKFSDTWQLIINTGTTIVTFLMVFVIQNTQNRDGRAMQLKLDELINSSQNARVEFVDIEDLTDKELDELQVQFKELREQASQTTPS